MSSGAPDPSDQAVTRLTPLAALFPRAETLITEPMYPLGDLEILNHDGAYKRAPLTAFYQPVDTAPNKTWREAVLRTIAADGWHTWHESYRHVERLARPLLEFVLGSLHATIEEREPSAAGARAAAAAYEPWLSAWRNLPEPPITGTVEQRAEIGNAMSKWSGPMGNCVNQGLDFSAKQEDPEKWHRLLRVNASLGRKALQPFHVALDAARQLAGLDSIARATAAEEELFADIERAVSYVEANRPTVAQASAACRRWESEQFAPILENLQNLAEQLPNTDSTRLVLPDRILRDIPGASTSDMPFPFIVVGLRVNSFSSIDQELAELLGLIALLAPDFPGYLCSVAIHPLGRMKRGARAFSSSLAARLLGHTDEGGALIFPVELAEISNLKLGDIPVWTAMEDELIERLMDPMRKAAMALVAREIGQRVLNPQLADESAFFAQLEVEVEEQAGEKSVASVALASLERFEPQTRATKEWTDLLDAVRLARVSMAKSPTDFFPLMAALKPTLTRYLDAAYPPKFD